jgi:hypothetical protein
VKRYISAVLIPCLLLHLCGCYSQREITYDELISSKNQDIFVIIDDSSKYIFGYKSVLDEEIVMHPGINYCIDADTSFEKLVLQRKTVIREPNNKLSIGIDTLEFNKNEINSITIEEIDETKTTFLVLGIVAGIVLIGYLIALSTFELDMSGINLFDGYSKF